MNEDSPKANANPIGYITQESGCWNWVGGCDKYGYGRWFVGGRTRKAHRVMYERHKGPIPKGLSLDHLCRNPGCVNPDHLEAVTHRENVLRGESIVAHHARKTHCVHGHEYNKENTYREPNGARHCRACARIRWPAVYEVRRRRKALGKARGRGKPSHNLLRSDP